jgi:hypothetical protein
METGSNILYYFFLSTNAKQRYTHEIRKMLKERPKEEGTAKMNNETYRE